MFSSFVEAVAPSWRARSIHNIVFLQVEYDTHPLVGTDERLAGLIVKPVRLLVT